MVLTDAWLTHLQLLHHREQLEINKEIATVDIHSISKTSSRDGSGRINYVYQTGIAWRSYIKLTCVDSWFPLFGSAVFFEEYCSKLTHSLEIFTLISLPKFHLHVEVFKCCVCCCGFSAKGLLGVTLVNACTVSGKSVRTMAYWWAPNKVATGVYIYCRRKTIYNDPVSRRLAAKCLLIRMKGSPVVIGLLRHTDGNPIKPK